ncbi:MAG: hypothetical protein QOD88_737, partial [Mycobacterium sp.]|nr:hypothetical protein [Mycobacterium sp.]
RSDGSQLVTSETFNMAAMGQHLMAHPELVAGEGETEFDVETPPIHGPAFKGERLYAYWTADGEQPVLVPVAMVVVRGTVKVLTQAVTVSPRAKSSMTAIATTDGHGGDGRRPAGANSRR